MRVVDRAGLPSRRLEELGRAVAPLRALQDVVRWGFALSPPRAVAAVVVQDEYTHDVVLPWIDGLHLAFDTT